MMTAAQLRAARALLGIDQRTLAERAGVSPQTLQRMESSDGIVRGNIESLTKLVAALTVDGIELLDEGTAGAGTGRGVRFKTSADASLKSRT